MNAILFMAPPSHRLFDDADRIVRQVFPDAILIASKDDLSPHREAATIISFLSPVIVPPHLLTADTINFHPAPPDYPGRGSASIAIYEGASHYGATVHRMARKVDTGDILLTKRFPIGPQDGCEHLFERAENLCLALLDETMAHVARHGRFPPPNGERWTRQAMTRKQFEDWLIVDPNDPADMERKIRAARHSRFPGPYLIVNGHRFALCER